MQKIIINTYPKEKRHLIMVENETGHTINCRRYTLKNMFLASLFFCYAVKYILNKIGKIISVNNLRDYVINS